MNKLNLNTYTTIILSKGRNLCYYWVYVDKRPTKQYMHVLRDYRKSVNTLLENKYLNPEERDLLTNIARCIPENIKPSEIEESINNLCNIFSSDPRYDYRMNIKDHQIYE